MSPFISRLMLPSDGAPLTLAGFQHALLPLIWGIVIAIVLSFFIRETGLGQRQSKPGAQRDDVVKWLIQASWRRLMENLDTNIPTSLKAALDAEVARTKRTLSLVVTAALSEYLGVPVHTLL